MVQRYLLLQDTRGGLKQLSSFSSPVVIQCDQLGFSKLAHYYRAVPPLKTGIIKMKSWWLFFQKLLSITNHGSGGSSVRDKGLTLMKSTSHFGSLAH